MINVTQLQRSNILSAREMWLTVPEANVIEGLKSWRKDVAIAHTAPTCDTLACFGGWCAWWPEFRAQGVVVNTFGSPRIHSLKDLFVDEELFGSRIMFNLRGLHVADKNKSKAKWSDWRIVLNRIDHLIKNSVVTTEFTDLQ